MIVKHLTYGVALDIAERMRPADRSEILTTRWNDDLEPIALDASMSSIAYSLSLERPIAAIGGAPRHPGVWTAWMYATDEFPRIGRPATTLARRAILPAMIRAGAHRIEMRSAADHAEAHRWIEVLGGKVEATLREYGRDKRDFLLYVWRRET